MTSRRNSTMVVYDAVVDLHNLEQPVTREAVKEVANLEQHIIDDRLAHLVGIGEIVRVQRGVFAPAIRHEPARAMSKTLLPDGKIVIDVGDEVLTLTPKEGRALGNMLMCEALQFSNVQTGWQETQMTNEIMRSLESLQKQVAGIKRQGKKADE